MLTSLEALNVSKQVRREGGEPERLLRQKCNWEHQTRIYVIMNWGDPRTWGKETVPIQNETEPEKTNEWWENFKGKCVACGNAVPSPRKQEMLCQCPKAWDRGLPSRPGGTKFNEPVSKMFGCVYYVK